MARRRSFRCWGAAAFIAALAPAAAAQHPERALSRSEACRALLRQQSTVDPFIMFFEWNSDTITPEAAAILDNVVAGYRELGTAPVIVAGHTDRTGSAAHNLALSRRRADAVLRYLERRGVPRPGMRAEPFGETRPLVETEDGVREPQNRRTEIIFGIRCDR